MWSLCTQIVFWNVAFLFMQHWLKHALLFLEKKRETLQELLAALLDDTKETNSPIGQVPQLRDDPLMTDFEEAFDLASANNCIAAALNNM